IERRSSSRERARPVEYSSNSIPQERKAMKAKTAANGNKTTAGYQRLHRRGLTPAPQTAPGLPASGQPDTQTAQPLHLHRVTVRKWRLYDPVFQAALNQRRAEIWSAGIDMLRSLIPKALSAVAGILNDSENPNRLKAALEILRLAWFPGHPLDIGPTDPEEIVRGIVAQRRANTPGFLDRMQEDGKGLPPLDQHLADTWQELEALASETAGAEPPNGEPPGPA